MRRVIVQMSISLDGFVAPASGGEDHRAAPEDPLLKQVKLEWLRQAGTHAMGRVTYQEMAGHWPASTDAYAAPMNDLPKVVFSKSLKKAEWNDSGLPLFKDLPAPVRLRLVEATTYQTGAVLHVYRPAVR